MCGHARPLAAKQQHRTVKEVRRILDDAALALDRGMLHVFAPPADRHAQRVMPKPDFEGERARSQRRLLLARLVDRTRAPDASRPAQTAQNFHTETVLRCQPLCSVTAVPPQEHGLMPCRAPHVRQPNGCASRPGSADPWGQACPNSASLPAVRRGGVAALRAVGRGEARTRHWRDEAGALN